MSLRTVWRAIFMLLVLAQLAGCGIVAFRTPDEYAGKKLTVDPPAYQMEDKAILDQQK